MPSMQERRRYRRRMSRRRRAIRHQAERYPSHFDHVHIAVVRRRAAGKVVDE